MEITTARGCDIDRIAPAIDPSWLRTADGQPGLDLELFADLDHAGPAVDRVACCPHACSSSASPLPASARTTRCASGTLIPPETGRYTFSLVEAGRARLLLDDTVVVDGTAGDIARSHEFFGLGSIELTAPVDLVAGQPVSLVLEYSSRDSGGLGAVKVGCRTPGSEAELLDDAAAVAAAADLVVVAVGTNDDWESEGHDRDTLALPGAQDELLARVIAANPNTVVVVNAGAPVLLDATAGARAVVQVWLGGQEMADALVDVLMGEREPSGRLPTTIPRRLEDNPSYGNFPGEDGEVRYGEGVLMGYRWYETRGIAPRFPFGHGTSYTTFDLGLPVLASSTFTIGGTLEVAVDATNTGARRGAEVVQCYVEPVAPSRFRPVRELRAFEKVWLDPGEQPRCVSSSTTGPSPRGHRRRTTGRSTQASTTSRSAGPRPTSCTGRASRSADDDLGVEAEVPTEQRGGTPDRNLLRIRELPERLHVHGDYSARQRPLPGAGDHAVDREHRRQGGSHAVQPVGELRRTDVAAVAIGDDVLVVDRQQRGERRRAPRRVQPRRRPHRVLTGGP